MSGARRRVAATVPLRLDLLRHAAALPSAAGGDAERPLSPAGERAARTLGERLALEGWTPGRVLSSPYRRARATAELVLQAAGLGQGVTLVSELEPDAEPDALAAVLGAYLDGVRHALLVTHQPLAGRLVERWCGAEAAPGPGTLLHLEFDSAPGQGPGRVVRQLH